MRPCASFAQKLTQGSPMVQVSDNKWSTAINATMASAVIMQGSPEPVSSTCDHPPRELDHELRIRELLPTTFLNKWASYSLAMGVL
ncbi:hypothetical protein H257_17034 [Aphanomyces astaci]|uniref:Uncharacterized protein n=1 Tax=Aphanomyces astaci TaxID=112090 RepID=W4FGQ2_APHAT|nr:hypothetical protein H257_17034 [Aphanomyces astaci]ETV66605.1 hypothetical protein H257_17034 [Aphanomyces astaci]|eukprot:XP_009843976.1 hypothetical protein H257_17034 [Aphanomyces astaci]